MHTITIRIVLKIADVYLNDCSLFTYLSTSMRAHKHTHIRTHARQRTHTPTHTHETLIHTIIVVHV